MPEKCPYFSEATNREVWTPYAVGLVNGQPGYKRNFPGICSALVTEYVGNGVDPVLILANGTPVWDSEKVSCRFASGSGEFRPKFFKAKEECGIYPHG